MDEAVKTITGGSGPADILHEGDVAFDDQSGAVLDPSLVREARKSEISYFNQMGGLLQSAIAGVLRRNRSGTHHD